MKTKKNFLKKLTAVALGFVMTLGVGAAGYAGAASETHAGTSTFTYTSKADPTGLTASPAAGNFESGSTGRAAQWSNNEGLTLTTSSSFTNVSKVTLVTSTNANNDAYSISCAVGGTSFGGQISLQKGNNQSLEFTQQTTLSGAVVISYTLKGTKKSVYVKSITVETSDVTTYTVNFNSNSGSGSQTALTSTTNSFTLPSSTTFIAPSGKQFDGWGTSTSTSSKISGTSYTIPSGTSATLYALWKDIPITGYKIVFNANGGSGTQDPLDNDSEASFNLPTTTTFTAPNSEKMFDGWSETTTGAKITANPYEPTGMTSGSTKTLYARWIDKVYSDIPAGTYSADLIFDEYSSKPSSASLKILDDDPATGKYYKKISVSIGSNVAWNVNNTHNQLKFSTGSADSYKVVITNNTNAKIDNLILDQGQNNTRCVITPSPTSTTSVDSSKAATGFGVLWNEYKLSSAPTTVKIETNTNYLYVYSIRVVLKVIQPYDVGFDGNGADNWETQTISETPEATYVLPTSEPTRAGYNFAGWWTSTSGGTQVTSTSVVPATSVGTLYAHWSPASYTVTFDAEGGSVSPGSKSVTYGGTYGDLPTPTKSGFKFNGWYTAASGGTKIESATTVSTTAAQTLHAQWTAKTQVQLTADKLELDLFGDAASGKAAKNPNASGVTYTVIDTGVATYDSSTGKFKPIAVGNTTVTMSKGEDDNNVYLNGSFDIEVSAAARLFTVSATGTNCTVNGATEIYENTEESYTISASANYKLPTSVIVSGASVKSYTTNDNCSSATLVIHEATGNVSFTVSATAIETYSITYSGLNYEHSNITQITEFTSETITLSATGDYKLPNDVTVDGATKNNYNASTGALSISNPTANVTITCNPVALASYTITVTGSGTYSDKFTYSGASSILESRSANVNIIPNDVEEGDAGQYIIEASDISVIGADKGTYSSKVLSISNPTGNVTITVTPRYRVLTSLAVTTAPNKTVYTIGEAFSFDGAVITGTNNDGTSAGNVTSDCTVELVDPEGMLKAGNPYVKITHNPTGVTLSTYQITVNAKSVDTKYTYEKVTDASTLEVGDVIVIAAKDYNYALSTTQNTNNRGQATITKTTVDEIDQITWTENAGVQLLTLVAGTITGTFGLYTGSGYLYAASSSNNYLKTEATLSGNSSWTVGATSLTANGTNSRKVMQYNSSSSLFSCYSSASQAGLQLYVRTEHSTGAATLVGLTASYTRTGGDHPVGENVLKNDLFVKAWYDDGTTKDSTSDETFKNAYTIVNPTLSSTSNTVQLSYTDGTITKTCNVTVPAVQIEKEVVDVQIEAQTGYKTSYIYAGSSLSWDLTNIKAKIIWDSGDPTYIDAANLTNLVLNPSAPSIGDESFTISGSYMNVSVNSDYNTVSGISVVAKGITSFGTWSLSTAGGGFKWANYVGDKFDYNHLGTCKPTWNDGTSSSTTVSVYDLIMSGEASIGLFETYGAKVTPDAVIDSSNLTSFEFSAEQNGYRMALMSPYVRSPKDASFTIYSFDQNDLNAVTGGIGMAYKYTHNDVTGNVSSSNIEKTVSTLATENSWEISSGSSCNGCYTSFNLNNIISISSSGEANCGSVWGTSPNNDWRLYQNKGGDITITAASGYMIEKINLTFTVSNTGALYDGDNSITSASDYTVNDSSITLDVGNSGSATNGQVRITKFSVTYKQAEYSGVDFRFKLQYNGIQTFADNNEMFAKDYGLKVSYGDNVLYFSVLKQGIYQLDGTKVTDLIYLGSSDSGYFVLKLGDVINDRDRASTEFTVQPYVIGENDKEYLSSSITTYSVESIVQHYHEDPATAKAASVVALYEIFFGEEE